MSHELVIRSDNAQVAIAILKDKLLTELHREKTERGDLSGGEARAVQRDLAALARGLESERQARERKATGARKV